MNQIIDINLWNLAIAYLLLILPLAILLYQRVRILKETAIAVIRMTVQLLFVGLYLQVVFRLNNPVLNIAWVVVMIIVADVSILHGCKLNTKRFLPAVFAALLAGTAIPVLVFLGPVLTVSGWFDAQYVIPLAGVVLGNCLRSDIIGLNSFYQAIKVNQKAYHHSLAQGARLSEALSPFFCEAIRAALMPTIASMATIGLVALPGMMTGVILAGADPFTAIKYQIAIMIAIFSGTAVTVFLAIWLTIRSSFSVYGTLNSNVFRNEK